MLGPLPVEWTPTLSPEHVTCKPFSDTPNPYGMRRRNNGNYEPYNTNNGENHCILAKYVTRWVRWTRAGPGFDSETPLTPMSATVSSPRLFAFMMCSQSKLVSGAGQLVRPFRNVLHDPDRKHQPLSFQWVTRVGSRGEEKKCKEISASARRVRDGIGVAPRRGRSDIASRPACPFA